MRSPFSIVVLTLAICVPTASPAVARAQVERIAAAALGDSNVWKGSFTPDDSVLYLFRKVGKGEDYRIFVMRRRGADWSSPERMTLGADVSELYPTVSRDGQRMVFTSYRQLPGDTSSHPQAMLWMASRRGNAWGEPVFLSQLNVPGRYHSQPSFDDQGTLYFRRDGADYRNSLTYAARWNGTSFEAPEPFEPINRWVEQLKPAHAVWGGMPAPDLSYIVLEVSAINAQGRREGANIWVTCRRGTGWTDPAPLGEDVNSPQMENFLFPSGDGRRLYFVRGFSQLYATPVASFCQR